MAEELKETKGTEPEVDGTGKKKFMEIAEFRMLVYVIPVALIVLVLALILGKQIYKISGEYENTPH